MKSIDLAAINSALNADMTEFNSKALQWTTQINTAQLKFSSSCIYTNLNIYHKFKKKKDNKEKKQIPKYYHLVKVDSSFTTSLAECMYGRIVASGRQGERRGGKLRKMKQNQASETWLREKTLDVLNFGLGARMQQPS